MRDTKLIQILLRGLSLLAILFACLVTAIPIRAVQLYSPFEKEKKITEIDFEGPAEGARVKQITNGQGMHGNPVAGVISVFSERNGNSELHTIEDDRTMQKLYLPVIRH